MSKVVIMNQLLPIFARELLERANEYYRAFKIISSENTDDLKHSSYYLSSHSLELYLKAFLVSKKFDKTRIRSFNHKIKEIYYVSKDNGLAEITDLEKLVLNFSLMNDVHDFRYPTNYELHLYSFEICLHYLKSIKHSIETDIIINDIQAWDSLDGYRNKTKQYKWTD